jgi:signal transduction histidine kinase
LGIGLSVTRALVAEHGGRVWLESVEGEGTSAFVELPLASG